MVSVPKEVEKISKAELYRDYCDWFKANTELRSKVAEEVLATFRKDLRDPTWVPRGVLSGGASGYGLALQKKMHQIWNGETKKTLTARLTGLDA